MYYYINVSILGQCHKFSDIYIVSGKSVTKNSSSQILGLGEIEGTLETLLQNYCIVMETENDKRLLASASRAITAAGLPTETLTSLIRDRDRTHGMEEDDDTY